MALRPGVSEIDINSFGGAITRLDPYAVDLGHSLYSQNCAYLSGQTGERFGHSVPLAGNGTPLTQSQGAITSFINWFFSFFGAPVNTITYYCPAVGVQGLLQRDGTLVSIISLTGAAGAVLVPAGERLYVAFYNSTGKIGFSNGQVYGWDLGADPLFAAPIPNTISASEPSSGVVTAGTRRIAYLFTTRNGYTGLLCPYMAGGFTPTTFTCSGGKNLELTISGTLPSYLVGGAAVFQAVMTTTTNLNQYFAVPGANAPCFNPTNLIVNINDDDLAATGTDVTAYMNLLATVGGVAPIESCFLFTYSSRMGYIGIDTLGFPVVYFSEPNNYQYITADQHAVYVEGQQQVVAGYSLRGVAYLATQNSHFSVEDNGDVPATWIPPQKIDGSIGVQSPTCITTNPSLGYALVASERGLYVFQGGVFPPLPVSYYQDSDWSRINWNVPTTVQVVDDPLNKKWSVLAPLNDVVASVSGIGPYTVTTKSQFHLYQTGVSVLIAGVTGAQAITVTGNNTFTIPGGSGAPAVGGFIQPQIATHEMTWDYTEGDTADTVKYSLDSMGGYLSGAIAQILNAENFLTEVWSAPASVGAFIRRNNGSEANAYRDISTDGTTPTAINSWTQAALVPGSREQLSYTTPTIPSTVHNFHGVHLRAKGIGNLNMQVQGLDGTVSLVPAASPLALSVSPGKEFLVQWFLRSEQQSFSCGTNAVDAYWILSLIRSYYTEAMPQR